MRCVGWLERAACVACDVLLSALPPLLIIQSCCDLLQVHLLHIIPVPMPEVIGGLGAMDSIVTVEPDPQLDVKHVSDAGSVVL